MCLMAEHHIVAGLRQQLAGIPGLRVTPQIPPALRIPGGGGGRALYQLTLTADDLDGWGLA